MRILILGAYGTIGSAVLARLRRDGHAVVGAGRSVTTARRRFPGVTWREADFHHLLTADAWAPLLSGIDVVVNCVGAFQTGGRDRLDRIHVEAPAALFAACEKLGVQRVVHISAIGAEVDSPSEFGRSKASAEQALRETALDWLILRPGVVVSPAAYGGGALLIGLAGVPLLTPLIAAERPIQTIAVEDIAETVAWAARSDAPAHLVLDLVHPGMLNLRDLVLGYRRWLGFASRPVWVVPGWLAAIVAAIADGLGWLGWRSAARSTGFAQLAAGVSGDPSRWVEATGIAPRSFGDVLDQRAATVQDRWFARLYPLKPLAIALIAAFWTATGIIALGPGFSAALAHLSAAGFGRELAAATVVGGAIFDMVLGLLLLVRPLAKGVLITMLIATVGYLVAGTLIAPALWTDPLGALTKVVPLLLATLFTLAVLDER
jgi:uncharacterized protein YbjT (DUF2867 family)